MVNWNSPDIVDWKKEATNFQQELYEKLGDRIWDYIKDNERWALQKKVGFALYGEPSISCDDEKDLGYDGDQKKEIDRICKIVYEKSGTKDLYVAFLFIVGKSHENKFPIPIIKVRSGDDAVFLDSLGRTYKNWLDFKSNNKLPKSLLCYPLNGTYQSNDRDEVLLEFSTSPACNTGARVCGVLDKTTSGVGLVATGVGLAGLAIPVAAPLAIASSIGLAVSGVYGLFRGSQHLHDRRTHKQTISPRDSEARNCWLSVLGGAFGIGSAVAVTGAAAVAARGGLLGTTSKCIINFLNFGSLSVNGLGIVNGLAYLVERKQRGELTALDVFQWSASIFFFYNAAVNIKTANTIVKDVQDGIKSDFVAGIDSKRRMKAWRRLNRETVGEVPTMEGNARLIKGITNIGSKDELFRLVIKGQTKFDKGIKFNESGFLIAKGQMFFDTKAGINYRINYNAGGNFFHAPKVNSSCILLLSRETMRLMKEVTSEIQRNSIIIDDNIVLELNDDLVSKLSEVFSRYCDPGQDEGKTKEEMVSMLSQAEKFAKDRGCRTKKTFINYYEFLLLYKKRLLKTKIRKYEDNKIQAKSCFGDDYNEDIFNNKWKVQNSECVEEEFLSQINKEIEFSNADLLSEFDKHNTDVMFLNELGSVKFRTCAEALVQFYRCFVIDLDERLTLQDYFRTIRRTVDEESTRLQIDVNCKKYLYYDNKVPVVVIVQETDEGKYFKKTSFKPFNAPEGSKL
ncbi:uncharacterized protein LOC124153620 isoform X1 [Ischnura elegans]|uniref:uncharacterized protein LOC124153620 isoform X1 n=1 Tax=Ischnura elegans TaxID=197161 RepID=UPI001ED8A8EB|nr:uncharacterized protein LOC124153620 isoform X1 [Ischnura elegans]